MLDYCHIYHLSEKQEQIWSLLPGPGKGLQKPLGLPDLGSFVFWGAPSNPPCVMLTRCGSLVSKDCPCLKSQACDECWNVQPHPLPTFKEDRRAGDWSEAHGQWFNSLSLCNETLMKTLDNKASWLAGEHMDVSQRWGDGSFCAQEPASPPPLYISSSGCSLVSFI